MDRPLTGLAVQTVPVPAIPDDAGAARLLALLADGADPATIAAASASHAARDLALAVASGRDASTRREATLAALLDTARELASETDPALVLDSLVRRARSLTQTDVAYLTLYDPAAGDTYMRATDGSVSARFQSVRLPMGAGLGGLAASTLKPYWTANYPEDERFHHTSTIDDAVGDEGIVAICAAPLVVGSTFVGVIFVANRHARPFPREEVAVLGDLATLAAVALLQTRALADAESALAALSEAHTTMQQHTRGVERAAVAHDRFASLVLEGGGLHDLTTALGSLLDVPVAILGVDGGTRATYTRPGSSDSDTAALDTAALEAVALEAVALDAAHDRLDDTAPAQHGRSTRVDGVHIAPIVAGRERLGVLLVAEGQGLDGADVRTLERAALVAALLLLFQRAADDARRSVTTRAVSDLVAARGSVAERENLCRSVGFEIGRPFSLLLLRPDVGMPERTLLISAGTAAGAGALVGAHDGDVVALVPGEDAAQLAHRLAERLGHGRRVTVAGVGPVDGIEQLPQALAEGTRTAAAMVALGRRGTGAGAGQLGFAGLIVGSDPDVEQYVVSVLGPVLDYDRIRGTELVTTLAEYFAAGSSPRAAAAALHVHANTVAQRLDRIGILLGDGWQSPDTALEIQLALRLRQLLVS